jgi:hypothetical protein
MPRPWRTVYKSANKRVLVKPHKRYPPVSGIPDDTGLSWWWPLLQLIAGLFVMALIVDLVITFWPIFAIGLVILAIFFALRH